MTQEKTVKPGKPADLESWMALVRDVRGNFPGLETEEALEEHRQTVLRFMEKEQALCVKRGDMVVGVLLFSKKHNMICCLAVAPETRRQGIGSALLEEALSDRFFALQLRDETTVRRDLWDKCGEDTLRGLFLQELRRQYDAAPDDAVRRRIEQAARFGTAAMDDREV